MGKPRRLIVIGNGMSGIATIEHLLKKTKDMDITVLGTEPHVNYNRVLLSSVLSGDLSPNDIILNSQEWYNQNGINLHTGTSIPKKDGGAQRAGIFAFRNLDDTRTMMEWAHNSRKAMVIGGGLLGLEAARGLV